MLFRSHGVSKINPADSHLLLFKKRNAVDYINNVINQVDNLTDIHASPLKELVLQLKELTVHGLIEVVDELRVKGIAALKLPAARLAYLSACSTALSTSSELADEVTHIVSSFHIAGFVHVIGTLWPSEDEACQKMAVDFYSELSKTHDVAVSYRTAIMGLMKEKPSQPKYWAPFIHFGA